MGPPTNQPLDLIHAATLWGTTADPRLGRALDAITARYGTTAIGYGTAGLRTDAPWQMRRDHLSPAATTHWDELLTARP
ncbi:DUF4113 domain-containing protein [Austwickia chelonae]|uniref:DUF4113 domain-containing protein n=1 Tax=Austwickia chelonae TaxID=100225 RepID=UPI0009D9C749